MSLPALGRLTAREVEGLGLRFGFDGGRRRTHAAMDCLPRVRPHR